MHKAIFGLIVALTALSLPDSWAGGTDWKDETPQAAEGQLEKMRAAAGKLDRFEIECRMSDLDNTFAKDERWHLQLYADEIDGFRSEIRPVDLKHRTARRTASGGRCELTTKNPETWVFKGDMCTAFDETHRTYQTTHVGPKSWLAPLKTLPHQFLPPWLDPSVDWKDLKSRCKIKRASSTDSEFLVEFSLRPRKKVHGFRRNVDERLESTHELLIDRRTNLPKRWRMVNESGTQDRIALFERIDLKPAKRELKVDLTGYQDAQKVAAAAQKNQPPAKDDGGPFQTIRFVACCIRVLLWGSL
jgi:hypothetical protein